MAQTAYTPVRLEPEDRDALERLAEQAQHTIAAELRAAARAWIRSQASRLEGAA